VRETITTEAELREVIGSSTPVVQSKISDRLNDLTRQFVERSPFMLLATSSPDGSCDVSPRGDPAGFVHILDEETLLVPERPGNKLADSLRNVLANPHVGLLFLVPGVGDTLRVNGRAALTTDPTLLEPLAVEGKTIIPVRDNKILLTRDRAVERLLRLEAELSKDPASAARAGHLQVVARRPA